MVISDPNVIHCVYSIREYNEFTKSDHGFQSQILIYVCITLFDKKIIACTSIKSLVYNYLTKDQGVRFISMACQSGHILMYLPGI